MNARGLWVACGGAVALAACGGGGGGGGEPAPQPSNPPARASVSRMVVSGTSIYPTLTLDGNALGLSGTLHARVTGGADVLNASVTVTADGNRYTLELSTLAAATVGPHAGETTVSLCRDAACTTPQATPSLILNYDVDVLAPGGAWPGNRLSALTPFAGAPEWSTFQGNGGHTGHVPVVIDPDRVGPRWRIGVPSFLYFNGRFNLATVTTEGGRFFMAGNNAVTARSEHDGSTLWSYSFTGLAFPSVNPPAVRNGTVYVSAGQQSSTTMFGLDASDGAVKFRSGMSNQWSNYLAPTVGPAGVYANAGTYGGMYAFDLQGSPRFFTGTAQQSSWTPAVDAVNVYAFSGEALRVIHPSTGTVQRTIGNPTYDNYIYEIGGSAVLGASGSVFAAQYGNSFLNGGGIGNSLLHFNVPAASVDWSVRGVYPTTPAYDSGVVYIVNNNPLRLEARAESDGALRWWWTPPHSGDTEFISEVLLTNNAVIVSTNRATYAVDRVTHRAMWSYPATGNLALSPNGVLYIAGQGTQLLTALNVK